MASLPIGSDKLLEIRTANVDIIIKSKNVDSRRSLKMDAKSSRLNIGAINIERVCIPAQEMIEEYTGLAGYSMHNYPVEPMFFEQSDYSVIIKSRNGEHLDFHSSSHLIEERIGYVLDDDKSLLSGIVNFGNSVGFCDFIISANGITVLSIRLEVYPTKMSYKEDYQEMMADINNMVNESVLDFLKRTYQLFIPNHKQNEVPAVFFTVLQTIYDRYLQSINRITSVPNHKLVLNHEVIPFYKAKRIDSRSEKWLQKHPESLKKMGDKLLAERVLSARKQITYDTHENRLVKFMLQSTVRKISDFEKRYVNSTSNPDHSILAGTRKMAQELRHILSGPFFENVAEYRATQSMSLVFGMAPGYQELYQYYLMLQSGISMGGDIFQMSVKETAQLYEYWCFIKLYSILKDRYELRSPDIIKVNRNGVTVDLVKGRSSRVTFLNTKTGEQFYLSYNPAESKTQTVNQRPDNVLELEKKGSKTVYKYVFDAKYRIENNPDGVFYPDINPGPKVDDINTMHRYRDSIVYENPDSKFTFEKTMFGAYILFPYGNEEEYSQADHIDNNGQIIKGHKFYRSIDNVNIGGLPFLPSATSLVTKMLDALINDSSESAFERATLPIGIEDRIKTVDWNKREVLIGLVSNKEQLNLFINNKIYWTKRFDKNNLPIRYIALYEKEEGITYYGEMISWQQKEQRYLPGETNDSSDLYNVFEVLKWKKLKDVIAVEENGPNPISYTNYFLLSTSKSYSELKLRNEADYRLFIELRRRTETKIIEQENATAFVVGKIKVLLDKERIYVINDDAIIGSCSISEFNKRPSATFRLLQKYIDNAIR